MYPERYISPIQSRILWFTNSLLFLNPSLFNNLNLSTTKALSKLPPLARPSLFKLSISSYLQNVLLVSGVDSYYAATHGNGQINYGNEYYFNSTKL